jgi:hypothetical protein
MTAASINQAANDPQLQARVLATAQKELVYNEALKATQYGQRLLSGQTIIMELMWPLAADQEQQYATALAAGRGAPGHDVDIISDQAILSAVISFWPADQEPPTGGPTGFAVTTATPTTIEIVGEEKGPTTEPVHTADAT